MEKTSRYNRYLLCHGDATDIATWSNIPYFLLNSGLETGFLTSGLPLKPELLKKDRFIWNIFQLLRDGKAGGFQYSKIFAKKMMKQVNISSNHGCHILSLFPLLPAYPWPSTWNVSFYIDATTSQVFDSYGVSERIGKRYKSIILEREKSAYRQAKAVICMDQWAADSVIDDYDIAASKVHVVPGGANIDEKVINRLPFREPPMHPSSDSPLRLGFLGKDWCRKGGPFLLTVAEALEELNIPVVIRAIGPDNSKLPIHRCLQPVGFIDKRNDLGQFIEEVQGWHFGTLFSEAEAFGISNRECLRLGVPVLSHDVGGIASTIPDSGCGKLFSCNPSSTEVAQWIAAKIDPYNNYLEMRETLALRCNEFTWRAATVQLEKILNFK